MPSRFRSLPGLLIPAAIALVPLALAGQTPAALTVADYARAEKFLAPAVNPLVRNGPGRVTWLSGDRFWYRDDARTGATFYLVEAGRRRRTPLFDHARLAATLSAAAGSSYRADSLPFQTLALSADGRTVTFNVGRNSWRCDVKGEKCENRGAATPAQQPGGRGAAAGAAEPAVMSPDSSKAVFIRNWNLWVRDTKTGAERQLTTDGIKDYGYATDNAGWAMSNRAILVWSPDSRKIATFRQDQRNVREMHLVNTRVGHPDLLTWRYPLLGDTGVFRIERVVIEVDPAKVIPLKMEWDQRRSTLGDNLSMNDMKWSPDGGELAIASVARDHKHVRVRLANAATGEVRTVYEETSPTHFESRSGWRVWWKTRELIWYSQRDDWGHLYLYDLDTGRLKNRITSGEGNVSAIVREDEATRTIWFTGLGWDAEGDPYFRKLHRVRLDGTGHRMLTPEEFDHDVQLSPDARFMVSTHSTPDTPGVTVLRDRDGKILMELGRTDIADLLAAGYTPPMRIRMKGRDGTTDIHGLLYRPTAFDSTRRYPIVNHIYPGPQSGSVGSRAFSPSRGDARALAELGFVVVQIDGMGTPNRNKSFMDAYYGRMADNTIPDQIAGMKELAGRHRWIDIDRVGIWGHSGGGFATTSAMFRHPEFFKVGIAQAGNHDNRVYEDNWGERYQGLLVRNPDGTDSYTSEANQLVAGNLRGKLMLAHGLMDNNVPPFNTLLVVDELIKANRDFDLVIIPNAAHGFGYANNYMMRRRWDYFVTHLMGATPPREYEIGAQDR